jgi:hypothetical protein
MSETQVKVDLCKHFPGRVLPTHHHSCGLEPHISAPEKTLLTHSFKTSGHWRIIPSPPWDELYALCSPVHSALCKHSNSSGPTLEAEQPLMVLDWWYHLCLSPFCLLGLKLGALVLPYHLPCWATRVLFDGSLICTCMSDWKLHVYTNWAQVPKYTTH